MLPQSFFISSGLPLVFFLPVMLCGRSVGMQVVVQKLYEEVVCIQSSCGGGRGVGFSLRVLVWHCETELLMLIKETDGYIRTPL